MRFRRRDVNAEPVERLAELPALLERGARLGQRIPPRRRRQLAAGGRGRARARRGRAGGRVWPRTDRSRPRAAAWPAPSPAPGVRCTLCACVSTPLAAAAAAASTAATNSSLVFSLTVVASRLLLRNAARRRAASRSPLSSASLASETWSRAPPTTRCAFGAALANNADCLGAHFPPSWTKRKQTNRNNMNTHTNRKTNRNEKKKWWWFFSYRCIHLCC